MPVGLQTKDDFIMCEARMSSSYRVHCRKTALSTSAEWKQGRKMVWVGGREPRMGRGTYDFLACLRISEHLQICTMLDFFFNSELIGIRDDFFKKVRK